jgi:hypothetical protein
VSWVGYDKKCAICQEDYEEGAVKKQLAPCRHWFHEECIAKWNKFKPTCPTCKSVDPAIESNTAQQARSETERRQQVNPEAERREADPHERRLRLLETLVQRHEELLAETGSPQYWPSCLEGLGSSRERLTRLEYWVARQESWLQNIGYPSPHRVQPLRFHQDEWRLEYLEELTTHHGVWLHYNHRSN